MDITVRELREALLGLPDDMPVLIGYEGIAPPAVEVTVEENPHDRPSRALYIADWSGSSERWRRHGSTSDIS